jgi:hypothetical protein
MYFIWTLISVNLKLSIENTSSRLLGTVTLKELNLQKIGIRMENLDFRFFQQTAGHQQYGKNR